MVTRTGGFRSGAKGGRPPFTGLFIRDYLNTYSEASPAEMHRAYKKALDSEIELRISAWRVGHPTRKRIPKIKLHKARFHSFEAYVMKLVNKGLLEPTGRVRERTPEDIADAGLGGRLPEVKTRALYRLTALGHTATPWLNPSKMPTVPRGPRPVVIEMPSDEEDVDREPLMGEDVLKDFLERRRSYIEEKERLEESRPRVKKPARKKLPAPVTPAPGLPEIVPPGKTTPTPSRGKRVLAPKPPKPPAKGVKAPQREDFGADDAKPFIAALQDVLANAAVLAKGDPNDLRVALQIFIEPAEQAKLKYKSRVPPFVSRILEETAPLMQSCLVVLDDPKAPGGRKSSMRTSCLTSFRNMVQDVQASLRGLKLL